MKAFSVGSIVESICGKCNDVMGHTIMAMVGNEIVKVECRVCKSQHRFRPPVRAVVGGRSTLTMKKGRDGEPVSRQNAMTQASRPVAPKSAPRKNTAAMAAAMASMAAWQDMIRQREDETPRPYAMAETFAIGDFLNHPTFGQGAVTAFVPPDKIDVLFETGTKRLLCNKP